MKSNLIIFIFLFLIVSCKKEKSDAPNEFIAKQAGSYDILSWKKVTYQNNQESSSESASDVGTMHFNIVNYGFVSEGTYSKNSDVNSQLLAYMNPENICYDTFRWTGDENRLTFSMGWCNQKYVYTLTLDGYKKNKQTWTLIQADGQTNILSKEVFEVKKQ